MDTISGEQVLQSTTQKDNMEPLATCLSDITESLKSFSDGAETDFILLGIGLQSVHTNVSELTDNMLDAAKRMGSDEDTGVLPGVKNIVNNSLKEIKSCQDQTDTNLTQINALVERMGDLYVTSEQIKKFAKFLHAVALNIFVENARTDESFKLFSDIAQEIKELYGKITTIANGVYENVENAHAIHVSIHDKIAHGMTKLHTLTREAHEAVHESIAEAGQLMSFSAKTIEDAGMRSREISGQVSEIVMGVQFHDNMRQRIDHIIGQMNDLSTLYAPAAAQSDAGEAETVDNAYVCSVIKDQGTALKDVILEVEDVFEKNMQATEEIKKEVDKLLQGFWVLKSMDTEGHDRKVHIGDDPFSSLKAALTQLHKILDESKRLFEELQDSAVQAADIAAMLSEQLKDVRDISRDTHIKALNSIISADRLGEKGSTLRVLSQEMKELAAQSDVFVDEVENIIESIAESAREIGRREMVMDEAEDTEKIAMLTLDSAIEKISSEYEKFRKDSDDSYHRAMDLKKAISATLLSLDFFHGLSGGLNEYHKTFEKLYREYGGVEEFSSRGTIPEEKKEVRQDKSNGFGDNVELF